MSWIRFLRILSRTESSACSFFSALTEPPPSLTFIVFATRRLEYHDDKGDLSKTDVEVLLPNDDNLVPAASGVLYGGRLYDGSNEFGLEWSGERRRTVAARVENFQPSIFPSATYTPSFSTSKP
jgi:hypothetical protein